MKKSIGRGILVLNLLVIGGLILFCFMLGPIAKVKTKPPLIHQVNEIAADGEFFYTLDETFNHICKFSNDGEFQYARSYFSPSANCIFVNEKGNICRYEWGTETLFVYDESGELRSESSFSRESFKQIRDTTSQTNVFVKGVEYSFSNRFLFNSYVYIANENGETSSVVVETMFTHGICIFLILAFLAGAVYSGYQIVCYFGSMNTGDAFVCPAHKNN